MNIAPLISWNIKTGIPFLISGPCAAESRDQVLQIAEKLASANIHLFRTGVWKPRTKPDSFEGVGNEALKWLQEVKRNYKIPVTVEVARARHVDAALKHNIDVLWIGARTTANPFAVQEIAEALDGIDIPVMIKNPVNPELELWIGALERIQNAGISKIMAIHRGFSFFEKSKYRNRPTWEIPMELKRRYPELPIICDPSHITGNTSLIPEVAQKAMDLGFNGLMIETHIDPENALSDNLQQMTPAHYKNLLKNLVIRKSSCDVMDQSSLEELRAVIDKIDEHLLQTLAERMSYAEKIGLFKKENGITIYQPERWSEIIGNVKEFSLLKNLSEDLMLKIYEYIHKESIRKQTGVMNDAEVNKNLD